MPPASATVCALGIPGVRMSLSDSPDGVDLTFAVVGDAAELRKRAHEALAGTYPMTPESTALVRRVHATIFDEPYGLVVHAVPIDPAQLDSVRAAFLERLDDLRSGRCD
jgi:hypothetical protein